MTIAQRIIKVIEGWCDPSIEGNKTPGGFGVFKMGSESIPKTSNPKRVRKNRRRKI